MRSIGRALAITGAAAGLLFATTASAARPAAALSLAGAPAVVQDGADASDNENDTSTYINIGILAALVAAVLLLTGGDSSPGSP